MHLSAQEEYGLRCLLAVARKSQGASAQPVAIAEVADAEGLSHDYTAKLLRELRQGGLLVSTRGASGGYHLARDATAISVWQAIEVLGGPLFSSQFCESHAGQRQDCVHTGDCSVRSVWSWLGGAVKSALETVTVADLVGSESVLGLSLGKKTLPGLRVVRSCT